MSKDLYYITAYERRPVTRGYTGANQEEAIEKMAAWMQDREDEGREFIGGVLVRKSTVAKEPEG